MYTVCIMLEKIESTLAQLVAFDSRSAHREDCHDIITFVQNELAPLGLHIQTDFERANPWLFATTKPGNSPKILLAAHLDTVPASNTQQLTLRREGDKLYGRGVLDMKFAAACFIELLKDLGDDLPQHDIGVLFSTDEEIGGASVLEMLQKDVLRPELVILPDSSAGWQIEQRAKGLSFTEVIARGTNGHGSRPWESDNAFHKLLPALQDIRDAYPSIKRDGPTVSITIVESGKPLAMSQVPNKATATLDMRAFEPNELVAYKEFLQTLATTYGLSLTTLAEDEALILDKQHPRVQSFLKVYEQEIGAVTYNDAYGGTDGRHFAKFGIPCVINGIGGGGFHQADEWASRSDILQFYKLLKTFVLS